LYDSRSEVANLPDDRSLYYTAFFKQSVRGLTVGSTTHLYNPSLQPSLQPVSTAISTAR
ncbi:hypothetical protein HKO47_08605, partial [Neisseria meningitidis]|nr:hypothetical protein [Neisseria meningitidis]